MKGPTRTRAFVTMLTCALAMALVTALAAVPATAAISETKESQQAYEQQLASGQIASVTINKRLRRVHITLKDGRRFLYRYAPKEEPAVAAALRAKHVAVTVLTPAAAKSEASKAPAKHKIRYIVGGALIVIVLIVGTVLLIDRRRKRLAE